jgi:hypothetical protein
MYHHEPVEAHGIAKTNYFIYNNTSKTELDKKHETV